VGKLASQSPTASICLVCVYKYFCKKNKEQILYSACCVHHIGDSSNADVKERSSPSKKDSTLDNIMTKLFSGLDDDSDLGIRNVSG